MNYSKIYNIDFRSLANLLTPPFLRKKTFIDWLSCLLHPLSFVNYNLNIFRKESIYKVTHNGQVVYLQKVLNDKYDNELRRIRIQDSFIYDPTWVYPEIRELPVYVYDENNPVYIYDESAFDTAETDFVAIFPNEIKPVNEIDLNILEIQIKSLINYYKLAGKRYLILWT